MCKIHPFVFSISVQQMTERVPSEINTKMGYIQHSMAPFSCSKIALGPAHHINLYKILNI